MAFAGIEYAIDDYVRDLDELDRLIMVDLLLTDVNPQGNTVTPVITLGGTEVTLTAITSAARAEDEIVVNRLGPVQRLQYQYADPTTVLWYNTKLVIRPLDLGINIIPGGAPVRLRGRSVDPTTSLVWDIRSFSLPEDARHQNPIVRRLYVDAVTGAQTITPVLVYDDGTTSSLAGLTNATRAVTEYAIMTSTRVKRLRLDGDFTNAAIVVYDVELDMYIPPRGRAA